MDYVILHSLKLFLAFVVLLNSLTAQFEPLNPTPQQAKGNLTITCLHIRLTNRRLTQEVLAANTSIWKLRNVYQRNLCGKVEELP
jgi:hypothetical protein